MPAAPPCAAGPAVRRGLMPGGASLEGAPALVRTPQLSGRMPYIRLIQDDAGLTNEGETNVAKPLIDHKSVQQRCVASWDGNP